MDKTLKTVQTVCKVCKIFAEIAFVMLVVIASVCAFAASGIGTGNGPENDITLGIGIVFLMLSPLLKYGAELNEKAKQTEVKDEEDNL